MKNTLKLIIGSLVSGCIMLGAAMIVYSKGTESTEQIVGAAASVNPYMAVVCAILAAMLGIGFFLWRHYRVK